MKLRYEIGTKGAFNHFTDDTSFEDYASDAASRIGFRAFVLDDGTPASVVENELKKAIEESGLVFTALIYITSDEVAFEKVFGMRESEMSSISKMQIIMDSSGSFLTYEWR